MDYVRIYNTQDANEKCKPVMGTTTTYAPITTDISTVDPTTEIQPSTDVTILPNHTAPHVNVDINVDVDADKTADVDVHINVNVH